MHEASSVQRSKGWKYSHGVVAREARLFRRGGLRFWKLDGEWWFLKEKEFGNACFKQEIFFLFLDIFVWRCFVAEGKISLS